MIRWHGNEMKHPKAHIPFAYNVLQFNAIVITVHENDGERNQRKLSQFETDGRMNVNEV